MDRLPADRRRGAQLSAEAAPDLTAVVRPLDADHCTVRVRVQPGARRDGLVGLREHSLRVRVAAPPVDGAANKALVRFLSRKVLGLPRSSVRLVAGERSRDKRVEIDAPAAVVRAALASRLPG